MTQIGLSLLGEGPTSHIQWRDRAGAEALAGPLAVQLGKGKEMKRKEMKRKEKSNKAV